MILVVEDNDFVRMQLVKFLTDGGFDVVEANGAEAALDEVASQGSIIDLMLVDVRMEPIDGFDFMGKVKTQGLRIPTIIVTGDDNPDILSRASQMGAVGVLMKPVNKDRLLKMTERAIAGSRYS